MNVSSVNIFWPEGVKVCFQKLSPYCQRARQDYTSKKPSLFNLSWWGQHYKAFSWTTWFQQAVFPSGRRLIWPCTTPKGMFNKFLIFFSTRSLRVLLLEPTTSVAAKPTLRMPRHLTCPGSTLERNFVPCVQINCGGWISAIPQHYLQARTSLPLFTGNNIARFYIWG